ncbi:hypothetical protein [Amycolatopsis thermoflava]|uniref:hypothetical protein n=1 Tax=Amycolatopsis thermoflava TaxID=84480 RepID=UPI003F4A6299
MSPGTRQDEALSRRALAMLRAAATGRAEMVLSSEPDMFFDGLPCCDQYTAHLLARRGLVAPAHPGRVGQRVRALVTSAGIAELESVRDAA